jgi:hypothetical protein
MKVIARLAGLACIILFLTACASLPLRAGQQETATKLRGHYILVHEDGHPIEAAGTFGSMRRRALTQGAYESDILDAAILRGLDEAARASRAAGRPLRILVFVHGGLNGYRQAFDRMTQLMLPSGGEAGLLARTTYYPIFVNWNASLGDSITDDLFFIRFGRRVPLAAVPTAPFVLLSRMAATLFGAPIAWSNTVQNYWDGFEGPPAEDGHFWADTLDSAAWLLPRLVTTPMLDAFGGPAWQIMKRRAQLATANRLPGNDHANEGAARTLVKQLQERTGDEGGVPVWRFTDVAGAPATVRVEITLVGHSMGTIVINRLLAAVHPLPVRQIVYLAPASGIDEFEGFLLPYLAHHPGARFTWFSLSRRDEARESYYVVPRGTLLAWIDGLFERGWTVGQMTQGRATNTLAYYGKDLEEPQPTEGTGLWRGQLAFRRLSPEEKARWPFDLSRVDVFVTRRAGDEAPRKHSDFDEPRFLGEVLCHVDAVAFREPGLCARGAQ